MKLYKQNWLILLRYSGRIGRLEELSDAIISDRTALIAQEYLMYDMLSYNKYYD